MLLLSNNDVVDVVGSLEGVRQKKKMQVCVNKLCNYRNINTK
jgi:hypothetical protein